MKRSLRSALALCAPLMLWSGCFTEVGNPAEEEQEMTAVLRVATTVEDSTRANGAPDSVRITHLLLELSGVEEYSGGQRKRTHWADKQAKRRARFAAGDTLASQRLASKDVDSLVVRLRPVGGGARRLDLDTVVWETFAGPGYVKGSYTRRGVARRFLFALPDNERFSPVYTRATLESWRYATGYKCLFLFRPRTWLAAPALDDAEAFAIAGGDSVVVFDPWRNATMHRALLRRFGRSFNDAGSYGAAARTAGD